MLAVCQDSEDVIALIKHNSDVMAVSAIFPPFLQLLNRCLEDGEDELLSFQVSKVFKKPFLLSRLKQ